MIKRITFLLFLCCLQAHAQLNVGLQGSYIAPLGDMKYILKPAAGIELKFTDGDMDKRLKLGFSVGFMGFKPTQDTFRIYGTQSGGTYNGLQVNGTLLQPGYEHIYNYRIGYVGICSDYKILKTKLSPTVGLDFYAYIADLNEDYAVEGQISVNGQYENETTYAFSIMPKAGLSYELNDQFLLTTGCGRNMTFYASESLTAFWKTYIGVMYYFN